MTTKIGQVQESTLLKVKETFERIKKAFMAADSGVFLPTVVLIGDHSVNHTGVTMLRCLVADKMLESQVQKRETGGRPLEYRPTQGGWLLLERIEQFSARELYDRYMDPRLSHAGALSYRAGVKAAPKPTKAPSIRAQLEAPDCGTCGDLITDRRRNATKCWACEEPGRRMKAGKDGVTRSVAYLQSIGAKRAREEQERIGRVAGGKRGSEAVVRDKQVEHPPLYSVKVGAQLEAIMARLNNIETMVRQMHGTGTTKSNGVDVPTKAARLLKALESALREDA